MNSNCGVKESMAVSEDFPLWSGVLVTHLHMFLYLFHSEEGIGIFPDKAISKAVSPGFMETVFKMVYSLLKTHLLVL